MTGIWRLMLGPGSAHASECFAGGFIGTSYGIDKDLSSDLRDDWRAFNQKYIPVFLGLHPNKTRIGAGLACGAIWTVSRAIQVGDTVLSTDGKGQYRVGTVTGDYAYHAGRPLPHRRAVTWGASIDRAAFSEPLRNALGSMGTVVNLAGYAGEIEGVIGGAVGPTIVVDDESVEDPVAFAMERHLEDFLVKNWVYTELGKGYDIYEEEPGKPLGQQFPTDTGPLDILAISKDRKTLLVVELKRGRASDTVVGQTLRYMGYVDEMLANPDQSVRGAIVAFEGDDRIKRALRMTPAIELYLYKIDFKLARSE